MPPLPKKQGGLGNITGDASGLSVTATAALVATPQTLADWIAYAQFVRGHVVYADDPRFGGTWDATHDVAPAINAAMASLSKGGAVLLPPGTFGQVTAIEMPNDGRQIRLIGAGQTATTLQVLNGATLVAQIHQTAPASAVWYQGGPHEIAHLCLNGRSIATRNIDLQNGHGCHIHNIYCQDPAAGGSNIRFQPDGISGHLTWENTVGPAVKLRGGPGPNNPSTWGAYCIEALGTDSWFHGIVASYAATAGIYINGGNNKFRAVHVWGVPIGFWGSASAPIDIENCVLDTPSSIGIRIDGNNSKVQNNFFFWPSFTGTEVGIQITNPITGSLIAGNLIKDIADAQKITSTSSPARVGSGTIIVNNPGSLLFTGDSQRIGSNGATNGTAFAPFISLADGTTGNGLTRGDGAVDLNQDRSSNAQIASGAASFVQGYGNTASGFGAHASGSGCSATAPYSFVRGRNASDKGSQSKNVFASASFSAAGDAQKGEHQLMATTAATTTVELGLNGSGGATAFSHRIVVGNNQAYRVRAELLGRRADGAWVTYDLTGCVVSKGATGTTIAVSGNSTLTAGVASSGAPTIAAPPAVLLNTAGAFSITVTPPDAQTWHWLCNVTTIEVG